MKFIFALIVWLGFATLLATGLVWAVQGRSLWLLALSTLAFLVAFVRYGCRGH